ncbi:MAG: 1,4-alpha-glucan branching protein GlgB, partial [Lachnospiraceae bacterium]|nr:1,4-alpha-glucan branching protein GlgB [Lachnospiraceae bacterium]
MTAAIDRNFNAQRFYDGDEFFAYKYFGAHKAEKGVIFRTFALNADKVTLIGEFSGWKELDMSDSARKGFWELTVPEAGEGQMYKYVIYSKLGRIEHCDPYGFGMELRPGFASIVRDLDAYQFSDEEWMKERTRNFDRPLNIYELHLGSWKRKPEDPNGWYDYTEIADDLIAYVKKYHYTHVEIMPLSEHPFDGSWGYQNTGFFAPTSRYGTAPQLKELVDRLHRAGIGAIIDFVPAHFATDYYALKEYDGTQLYEYPESDVTASEWGSYNFIFARREVASFMQSAANYWLAEYHFDGLRMDAVSRLIYWMGNESRGENPTSINFLKNMNEGLHRLHPTAMLIAEDSTSYPGCTKPAWAGGLGFDYKWDLGWMNDTLDYFMKQSGERKDVPQKLTFSMYYFYNERYLLPFSHDEVVHGKKTIIDKIFGDYEMKFPQARALYMYMFVHPGKKLNFMGNEIAMFREWDENKEPDYFLLKYPNHDSFSEYIKELNRLYAEMPAFYEMDYEDEGFRWVAMNDQGHNVFGIQRYSKD